MSNSNRPFGFKPIGRDGGAFTGELNPYAVASDYATEIRLRDLVKLAGSADSNGLPTVSKCAAGETPIGIVCGVENSETDHLSRKSIPASTGGIVYVCDDPSVRVEGQIDGALAVTDFGQTMNLVDAATSTGVSDMQFDYSSLSSAAGTTEDQVFLLERLVPDPGNEIGIYARVIASFNIHQKARGIKDATVNDVVSQLGV